MFSEYPKWLRHDGQADVLVANAAAEAEQLAAWATETVTLSAKTPRESSVSNITRWLDEDMDDEVVSRKNHLLPQLDHDGNGEPGGSLKPAGDIVDLRATYKAKFGKRAFPGWNAEEIAARLNAKPESGLDA